MAIKFLNDQLFPTDIFLVDVSAGRVGINTLLPRTALEVVGTLRVWSGANTHTYVETSSGSNLGSIQGKKNSDNAVRALALNPLGGNVGINLGAGIIPSVALQVQGSAKIQADSNNSLSITTSQTQTTFANTGNGIVSPSMSFNTGADTRLTILGLNGNVGIGTTSPSELLHLFSTSGGTMFVLEGNNPEILLDDNNGDNVYIRNTGGDLAFKKTDGSSVNMTIEQGGNVGIGTTSPSEKLEVSGNIKLSSIGTGNSASSYGMLFYGTTSSGTQTDQAKIHSSPWATNSNGGNLQLYTSNASNALTERMRIDGTGNVGIGTTSPSAKLEVAGDAIVDTQIFAKGGANISTSGGGTINSYSRTVASNLYSALRVIENSGASSYWDIGATGGANTLLNFYHNGTIIPKIFFTNLGGATFTGNVGIGTTSPGQKLTVEDIIGIKRSGVAAVTTLQQTGAGLVLNAPSGYHPLVVKYNGAEKVRFTNAGTVGIGTTSPNAPLSVHNTTSTLGSRVASFYHNNGSENPFIEINSLSDGMQLKAGFTTGVTGHFDILTGGGSSFITLSPGSSEKMRITSGGDAGIGVTTPRAKLDVNGGVKVADDTDTASANKVGTLRYRYVPGSPKNFSYVDMCMQTGGSSYAWVNIVQNVWN